MRVTISAWEKPQRAPETGGHRASAAGVAGALRRHVSTSSVRCELLINALTDRLDLSLVVAWNSTSVATCTGDNLAICEYGWRTIVRLRAKILMHRAAASIGKAHVSDFIASYGVTNYCVPRWLVEMQSRDVHHNRMLRSIIHRVTVT